jgi:hypothetical protein
MDYKLELQNNNIDLQAILDSIKELPDAPEGGGGADTSDATLASGDQLLEGITAYGKDGKITGTIPSQSAKTITPTKSTQTAIPAGTYASGNITVAAIPSTYITTTDATATPADIISGKTAYVNGTKITGNLEIHGYYISDLEPDASIGEDGDLWLVRGE